MTQQRLFQQEYTNSNGERKQNKVNVKSWLHKDYSNNNKQTPAKEECKITATSKVHSTKIIPIRISQFQLKKSTKYR